jgi:hypothetical protein
MSFTPEVDNFSYDPGLALSATNTFDVIIVLIGYTDLHGWLTLSFLWHNVYVILNS